MLYRRLPQLKFPVKLDIGCGEHKQKGFIGLDVFDCGQEILWDVRQGIPLPNDSVSEIYTSHFLEHLTDDETYPFLAECMRVLKSGGTLASRLPHADHPTAVMVDHKTFWNETKVETLYNPRKPIPKFVILDNGRTEAELFFTLKKL